MNNPLGRLNAGVIDISRDQRGITGLETAIVLIAFVVVSSVFAFAALSTGLFTTDKAKETIKAGLSEARGTMELKGSVMATAATTGNAGTIDILAFQVGNAAAGEPIDMTVGRVILKYTDNDQAVNLDTTGEFTATQVGNGDGDFSMEKGEIFEISIPGMVALLATDLSTNTSFMLEVIPPRGAVLTIQRNTPISMEAVNFLH